MGPSRRLSSFPTLDVVAVPSECDMSLWADCHVFADHRQEIVREVILDLQGECQGSEAPPAATMLLSTVTKLVVAPLSLPTSSSVEARA